MTTLAENPTTAAARRNLSICVLDDDTAQVEVTSNRLEMAGFATLGTTSLEDAFEKVGSGDCRVVIADFEMPGMDGLTFLEEALQFGPNIYVILVTGYYGQGKCSGGEGRCVVHPVPVAPQSHTCFNLHHLRPPPLRLSPDPAANWVRTQLAARLLTSMNWLAKHETPNHEPDTDPHPPGRPAPRTEGALRTADQGSTRRENSSPSKRLL